MHPTVLDHFKHVDPIIYSLFTTHAQGLDELEKPHFTCYIRELCESIVSQQLSVKAARTIWLRSCEVVDWNNPESILSTDEKVLRACGLSHQKISYVKNIALAVQNSSVRFEKLDTMSDEDVIAELITVKGVGRWTAEMFLIFTLCREDVFSAGDLGLRNAIDRAYKTEKIGHSAAEELAMKWSPHRSIASRVLWKSLDNAV